MDKMVYSVMNVIDLLAIVPYFIALGTFLAEEGQSNNLTQLN